MRRTLVLAALALLVVLAGCSAHGIRLDADVKDMSRTDQGYKAKVALEASAPDGYTVIDPQIVGLDAQGNKACVAEFDSYEPSSFRFGPPTKTITCKRFPVAFVPASQSAPLALAEYGPGTRTESAGTRTPTRTMRGSYKRTAEAFVGYNASKGYLYESTTEDPVAYAKCRMRERNADVSVVRGPTPWMEWGIKKPHTERTYSLTVDLSTEEYTDDGDDGVLRPIDIPSGQAGRVLRRVVDRGASAEDAKVTESLTRSQFFALHRALYGQPVTLLSDLPHGEAAMPRARAWRSDHRTISCPAGTYGGDKKVSVTYAVRVGDEVWEVELAYREQWSGDAYEGDEFSD